MDWIRRAPGLAAVLMIGATVGCTAGSSPKTKEPPLGVVQVVRPSAPLALPLEAYSMSYRDYLSIQRASWRLTRECVERFGGVYSLPESAVVQNAPPDLGNQRRYGLFDPKSAAEYGYHLPPSASGPESGPSGQAKASGKGGGWNPTAAERVLVRGAEAGRPVPTDRAGKPLPAGGCSGEATRRVEATAKPPDEQLGNRLAIEAHDRSENDSRVRAALTKWVACMKQRGYSYRSIWEPNDQRWPAPATEAEIATAKADVACKQAVNLVGVWYAVEVAQQKQIIEDRSQELNAVRSYLRTTISNAARAVGAE